MPKRDDELLTEDIRDAAEAIMSYIKGMDFNSFCQDRKTVDAVIRNLEVIGEAASLISADFRISHPLVEWREMKDFRNKLIHDYFGIDLAMVWSVLQDEIPYNYSMLGGKSPII